MKTATIVGVGRLGGALAIALDRAGIEIERLITNRTPIDPNVFKAISTEPEIADLGYITEITSTFLFITTSDNAIVKTAASLSDRLRPFTVVFHCSGAYPSNILSGLSDLGNPTGSFHPLLSVSDPLTGAGMFREAYFCIEGDPRAVAAARAVASALGGHVFSIDDSMRALYHASAVMAAGHIAALIASASRLMEFCGLDEEEAVKVLLPLVRSTVQNISAQGPSKALTGPFARGDKATIERHLAAFDRQELSTEKYVYLALGMRSLELANTDCLTGEVSERLEQTIKMAMADLR
ncbi:MAG TPA: DUF2520 domain-containing protein [Pyrinomonadaceae bacterium]|nr:DUF2520 domain-containing protein [Pyrinomonadaceae bacterium]